MRRTDARVVVASRNPPRSWRYNPRITLASCDRDDAEGLARLSLQCAVLAHFAGPFYELPIEPLHAAAEAGANYVDVAEDREFGRRVRGLAGPVRAAGIAALSGLSVVPGMEVLFAEMFRPHMDEITSFRGFAAPDTRRHRGRAIFETMMHGVGTSFRLPRRGRYEQVRGWSEGEWVRFPPPLGKRLVYLVLEMADADVLPEMFGVQTVEFKAGSEWALLNRMLSLAGSIRARTGHPKWERYTDLVRAISWAIGRFGKNRGGVVFEIGGRANGQPLTHRVAVVGEREGGRIPSVLAAIAVEEMLAGRLTGTGLLSLRDWIAPERLLEFLGERGLRVLWLPQGGTRWRPFSLDQLSPGF